MQQRPERVSQLLQKEITEILRLKVRDPRVKDIVITHVKITRDLKIARVYFTDRSSGDVKESEKVLNHAKGFFKTELSRRVELRTVPDLKFFYDEFLDYSDRMDQLFEKIR